MPSAKFKLVGLNIMFLPEASVESMSINFTEFCNAVVLSILVSVCTVSFEVRISLAAAVSTYTLTAGITAVSAVIIPARSWFLLIGQFLLWHFI